ncbi:hypothetical protein LZK98_11815 [Sphingomonas cannabina]|uniref:hypothetical protein n=1 Tax=Sphingomonas cannabina TaxID=2899123 RepID=UPI001F2B5B9D|nr:hypothetical protein [Sphingomonas cannabina]UIJ43778.1 hypothetical protein LZK98_11815 [Sphingomonas cannabina]
MRRWGAPQLGASEAKAQLIARLYGCTDAALARLTVDDICRFHRVDRRLAEYELTIARQKRGVGAT